MLFNASGLLLELRVHFQYHVILIELRKDGGNLALAESVVKSVIDGLRENPQRRCSVAIDHQIRFQTAVLLIVGNIPHLRQALELLHKLWSNVQLLGIGGFQRILILRAADAVFYGQILHRLQVQRDAVYLGYLGCSRRIISAAWTSRSSRGFKLI